MSGLHPEIRKVVDAVEQGMADIGLSDIHSGGVEKARLFLAALAPPDEALPPIHSVQDREIPGPDGQIPIRIYRPNDSQGLPVLVWFHGGGWVLGDLDGAELDCRKLANDVGCVVISVDYRLAPETLFPGAVDDCTIATVWIASFARELGIDPRRIAVGGDSAGANLAACVAYRARGSGQPLAFQLLVYPVIDADFDCPSYVDNAQGYVLTRSAMQWFWNCYVPDLADRKNPHVSPIHAPDLSGVAPAMIITAEYDPLRDEGEAYGAALRAASVPVLTQRYEGVIHGFFNTVTEEPVEAVSRASSEAAGALRRAFGME